MQGAKAWFVFELEKNPELWGSRTPLSCEHRGK